MPAHPEEPVRVPSLVTERLELKPLAAEAGRLLGTDRIGAASVLGASLHPDWPSPDVSGLLADAPWTASDTGDGIWVVVERATATVVGDAGFHGPPADGSIEIGYSIVPDRRRRGYATEAAAALVRWALARPDVTAVVAECSASNLGSIKTLERTGFRRTGSDGDRLFWCNDGGAGEAA